MGNFLFLQLLKARNQKKVFHVFITKNIYILKTVGSKFVVNVHVFQGWKERNEGGGAEPTS